MSATPCPRARAPMIAGRYESAAHVDDLVRALSALVQELDGPGGRHDDELHLTFPGLRADLLHDRERALGSGAHHQSPAVPGDLLRERQRGVAEIVSISLRRFLAPLVDVSVVDDEVVVVVDTVDPDLPEVEPLEPHTGHSSAAVRMRMEDAPLEGDIDAAETDRDRAPRVVAERAGVQRVRAGAALQFALDFGLHRHAAGSVARSTSSRSSTPTSRPSEVVTGALCRSCSTM